MIRTETFIFDFTNDYLRGRAICQYNARIDMLTGTKYKIIEFLEQNRYRVCVIVWEEE